MIQHIILTLNYPVIILALKSPIGHDGCKTIHYPDFLTSGYRRIKAIRLLLSEVILKGKMRKVGSVGEKKMETAIKTIKLCITCAVQSAP